MTISQFGTDCERKSPRNKTLSTKSDRSNLSKFARKEKTDNRFYYFGDYFPRAASLSALMTSLFMVVACLASKVATLRRTVRSQFNALVTERFSLLDCGSHC